MFYYASIAFWLVNVVVATELMFSYSFARVNDEFYERRGHKLSRTDGRCNSLRRWMAAGDGGNRDAAVYVYMQGEIKQLPCFRHQICQSPRREAIFLGPSLLFVQYFFPPKRVSR